MSSTRGQISRRTMRLIVLRSDTSYHKGACLISSINERLDALAQTVRSRLPAYTVYAPDRAIGPSALFPLIQVYPWREHLERATTGFWGNVSAHEQSGAHGPDKYRFAILQAPLTPDLDEDAAKRDLNDAVDTVRDALVANPSLQDDAFVEQALDIGDYILTEWDGQGTYVEWHREAYIGAYITVDITKLFTPRSAI